jgi:hypothetical protein
VRWEDRGTRLFFYPAIANGVCHRQSSVSARRPAPSHCGRASAHAEGRDEGQRAVGRPRIAVGRSPVDQQRRAQPRAGAGVEEDHRADRVGGIGRDLEGRADAEPRCAQDHRPASNVLHTGKKPRMGRELAKAGLRAMHVGQIARREAALALCKRDGGLAQPRHFFESEELRQRADADVSRHR